MSGWQMTWEVARWEFRRFLKPKQLLVSVITMLVTAGIGIGVTRVIRRADRAQVAIAVAGGERIGLVGDTTAGRLALRSVPLGDTAALRDSVEHGDLRALVIVHDAARAELVARRDPGWRPDLEQMLSAAAQQHRLAGAGLDGGRLGALLAPIALEVRATSGAGPGRAERLLTILMLAVTGIGLMTGMGFIFAGITGEKQQRVTEQVVSAISPQRWIDGKILGLAGVAIVNALTTLLTLGVLFAVVGTITGRLPAPPALDHPLIVPLLILFPLLGFALWFTFLCAIAATIDDPHTSTKGSLLMIPLLPVAIAGLLFSRADSAVAQFFGVFPLTSSAVLPVRLLLADVAAWEIPVALLLLGATIWLLRRAAGKIFAVGMLMYGKEPTVREMWRWAREAT